MHALLRFLDADKLEIAFEKRAPGFLSPTQWSLLHKERKFIEIHLVSKVERLFCSRYNDDDEQDEEEEEDGGEDPYEFSLSAVIDECARMASQGDPTNPSTSSSGSSQSKKRKIIQSSYFSDEEDDD